MKPTSDCVPRKGADGARAVTWQPSLYHQIAGPSGNDDDLDNCLSGDARLHLLVGECGLLDCFGVGASRNTNDVDELAVDLDRDLELVFLGKSGIALGPGSAQNCSFAAEIFP